MRLLLVAALLCGWISTGFAQEPCPQPEPMQVLQKVVAYRWIAQETEVPITLMKRVRTYRMEPYEIQIPQPGPQPPDVDLCVPQCLPVGQTYSAPAQAPQMNCISGQCTPVNSGVNVGVDVQRPRGLLWRFRR